MTKRFLKDNRGQVLYAVLVTVMFLGVLSMITMGLTLQHYHAAQQKQAHVTDYYAADAVAELLRIGKDVDEVKNEWTDVKIVEPAGDITYHEITYGTVTIKTNIDPTGQKFTSWEVSYHAVETQAEPDPAE